MDLPDSKTRLWELPAHELARRIARRDVSSVEVVKAHIDRIEAVDSSLNAVAVERFEAALKEAAEIDDGIARGEPTKPLSGVPISIKESIDVIGMPTTAGLPSLRSTRAGTSDGRVDRLREAGAIVLCKSNVAQMLLYMESDNPLYGRTNNPWNAERTPGGSSGGEAALVAAGGTALGLGTDIGGSIRCPSHFCGIYGLKPTAGRCTDLGRYSIPPGQRAITSQVGPFARTVEDLAMALGIIDTAEKLENIPAPPLEDHRHIEIGRLRIAWFDDDGIFPASPACRRAVREAAQILSQAGATVTECRPPDLGEAVRIFYGLLTADGARSLRKLARGNPRDPRVKRLMQTASMSRPVLAALRPLLSLLGQHRTADLLGAFGFVGADHYWRFVDEQAQYQRRFKAALDDPKAGGPFDAVLCPSFALPALRHGASSDVGLAGSYTLLANLLGWPAGTAPFTRVRPDEESDRAETRDLIDRAARRIELGSAGLPIGVQIIARPRREHLILAVMRALETARSAAPDYPCQPGRIPAQAPGSPR